MCICKSKSATNVCTLFLYPHGNETKKIGNGYLQRLPTYVTYVSLEELLYYSRLAENGKFTVSDETYNENEYLIFNDNI